MPRAPFLRNFFGRQGGRPQTLLLQAFPILNLLLQLMSRRALRGQPEGFVGLLIGVGVLMLVCFWIGERT